MSPLAGLMTWFRNRPVRFKFTAIIVFTTTVALTLSSLGVATWDEVSARRKLPRDLEGLAGIIGTNVESALDFDDAQAATRTLQNLKTERAIVSAAIYDNNGRRFARYGREQGADVLTPASGPPVGSRFADGRLEVVVPIVRGNETIGRIFVASDLEGLRERRQAILGIVATVLVASIVIALLLGGLAQGLVSHRLVRLANVARAVTAEQDYTVRAVHDGADEVGDFILAFNRMLDEIGKRDGALRDARENLERRVTERTAALTAEIAERERTEYQLRIAHDAAEAAVRAKSAFLATMSHEIRTPMNGVLGMTNLVLATPLSSEQRELVQTIRESGEALLIIINDILDFSKVEAGRLQIESVDFDVAQVLARSVDVLAPIAADKQIVVACTVGDGARRAVRGDPARLRQVLLNLVGNAIKFTPAGRVDVALDVTEEDDALWLRGSVRDTGIGIDEAVLASLFQPFTQADSSTSRQFGGTGLGLAITKRLVELMGGTIGVESRRGAGSHFWFAVRCEPGQSTMDVFPRATRPSVDTPVSLAGVRVLLAEDNVVNQRVAVGYLQALQCSVDVVENGQDAVTAALEGSYDVVLMDCMMPEMDGYAATRQIRQRESTLTSRLPIVALTASAFEGERERCLAAGMDDYLTKPFRMDDLTEALRRWAVKDVLDQRALDDIRGLPDGADILRDAVEAFERTGAPQMDALVAAGERQDWTGVQAIAHAFTSASAMLGAVRLADRLRALDRPLETADPTTVQAQIALAVELFESSLRALDEAVSHEAVSHEAVSHEAVSHEAVSHEAVAHEAVAHEAVAR